MSVWGDLKKRSSGEVFGPEDITPEELNNVFREGIVHFQYRKKPKKGQPADSGEIRDAWGTKNMTIVSKIPHGGDCPPKRVGYTIYFDVEKADWRAFWHDSLICIWTDTYTESEWEKACIKYRKEETDPSI